VSSTVATTIVGPDALFLRIPRLGGQARVVAFPNVDSTIWTSTERSPAPGRVLGFDDDAGLIAIVDNRGRPARIDFRRDSIDISVRDPMTAAFSLDGSAIFGVTAKGAVVKSTPTAEWRFSGARPARGVLPLRDGSALIWTERSSQAQLTRVKPPSMNPTDSLTLPAIELAASTGIGDRLFFSSGNQLFAVQTRTLVLDAPISFAEPLSAIAVTPSGDKIFALTTAQGTSNLVAVDRYHWRISSQIPLESKARELRVDPVGRYVLVRGPKDSVFVVGIATNAVIGTVRSDWRDDLPLVAPDGSIVTIRDGDVAFVNPVDQKLVSKIGGGASDFWFPFWWTGFRPRAASLDIPVTFDSVAAAVDSSTTAAVAAADTARVVPTVVDSAPKKAAGFTVSFFALLSQQRAQTEAAKIQVGGETAHVETVMRDGVPVYRVILGPYATCADAQRAAHDSKRSVWIPEGGCEVPPPDESLAH
jgi:hypothetical protein